MKTEKYFENVTFSVERRKNDISVVIVNPHVGLTGRFSNPTINSLVGFAKGHWPITAGAERYLTQKAEETLAEFKKAISR